MSQEALWLKKKVIARAILCCVLAGGLFLVGFLVADRHWFPRDLLKAIEGKLARLINEAPQQQTTEIGTSLVRLRVTSLQVPGQSPVSGGGVAEVGGKVLLMTGDGAFFLSDQEHVLPLSVAVPSNHRAEYEAAAASPELAGTSHVFEYMRYHDLLAVEENSRSWLFVTFTEYRPVEQCYSTAVARLETTHLGQDVSRWSAQADSWQIVFRTSPCLPLKRIKRAIEGQMAGGRMAWDSSRGALLLASGDYHWDGVYNFDGTVPELLSQDPAADYGKVMWVDPEAGTAAHISLGHRNTQGLLLRSDGTMWVAEHGPRGGDELNLVKPGLNFGWPLVTYGTRYDGLPWTSATQYGRHEGFEKPVYAWVPSMGVSNLVEIRNFDASWDGDLLVGFLAGQVLHRVRTAGERAVFSEPIHIGERVRDVLQLSSGVIALWTDSRKLMFLARSSVGMADQFMAARIDELALEPERKRALEGALKDCLECHALQPGATDRAPGLHGIVGRRIASTTFAAYSSALRGVAGRWDRPRLQDFLRDPQGFAPGTSMPATPLEPETMSDLISILEELNSLH